MAICQLCSLHRKGKFNMILSIHGGHNGSAALIKHEHGQLHSFCVEFERLDRVKMSFGCELYEEDDFTPSAKATWINSHKTDFSFFIDELLKEANATISDIECIALSQHTDISRIPDKLKSIRTIYVPHHKAHASLAYYASNFDDALIVVCDGEGEHTEFGMEAQTAWINSENNKIKQIKGTYKSGLYHMGIANAYEIYTYWLGYGYNGCGTTMALASFDNTPSEISEQLFVKNENGDVYLNTAIIDVEKHVEDIGYKKVGSAAYNSEHESMMRALPLPNGYRLRNRNESSVQNDFIRMASDIQIATENAVLYYIRNIAEQYPKSKICMAGGTFLNCNLNSKIREMGLFSDIFVPTAPGDGGLALGAAFSVYFEHYPKCHVLPTAYIGTHIYPINNLEDSSIHIEKYADISKKAAELINDGYLVGWCQGQAEFGPRALGHRSLIADPRNPKSPERINSLLKHREAFRPFAPAVLEELYSQCFEGTLPIPYMLETRQVKPEWTDIVPAICHVDNSARVQVVSKSNCPEFYDLISNFYKLTGVPIVINTSLNRNGEPIVNSANDAIRLLSKGMLDYLVIGDTLYYKGN